jgi:cellulose synthase/poly-beta-1,6-N-acetylglucosamine synthase-like glycosyltransferase
MLFIFLATLPFLIVILVPVGIALLDYITVTRSRFSQKHTHNHRTKDEGDFTILVPIFGDMSYLKNVHFLSQYADKVILCTTTRESELFNREIKLVSERYRFRIFMAEVPLLTQMTKPNPWGLFNATLSDGVTLENKESVKSKVIKDNLSLVRSEYCIFIDGDTIAKDSLYKLIGLMKEKKFDLASVRILASKTDTIFEKLQGLEYQLAMDGRRLYPWLTSGAGVVAKRSVIKDIMSHHSLFFSGGDIEIGKIAGLLKYKVGHLYFEFYTDVPSTFKAWFKQRAVWSGGGFRHAIVNFYSYTWRHPIFFLYFTILVYGATPLRWYEMIVHPGTLLIVIVIYWFLSLVILWKQRSMLIFLLPFYSLFQIMVILPCGIYTYFKMALNSDNVGLIKLRYDNHKIESNQINIL